MEFNKQNIRKIMIIIISALLLYFGLLKFDDISKAAGTFLTIIMPFIVGGSLAFILNVPMRWIEKWLKRLFSGKKTVPEKTETAVPEKTKSVKTTEPVKKNGKKAKKPGSVTLVRVLSLVITVFLFLGVLFMIVFLLVPEIGRSADMIVDKLPAFKLTFEKALAELAVKYPSIKNYLDDFNIDWESIGQGILNFVNNAGGSMLSSTIGVATSVAALVFNSIIAFVFAMNILLQKEKLAAQGKRIIYAFLPKPAADRTIYVFSLTSDTFARFLSGQGREAVILGFLFFIAMIIFRFPYALLISILIGVFALIPMFGAFIGCVFGVFFIMIVDPMMAVWFVVLFLILQQIEGNLIYPFVVGGSIGLPSIWVLVAVTVGGSIAGVVGMLVFIPLASVLYVLFREIVGKRLQSRGLEPEA